MTKEWFYKLSGMLGPQLVGVNVMHTNFSTMSQTLKFVREECGWGGPLGAYVLQCYVTVRHVWRYGETCRERHAEKDNTHTERDALHAPGERRTKRDTQRARDAQRETRSERQKERETHREKERDTHTDIQCPVGL
jgi:hypothetical protein